LEAINNFDATSPLTIGIHGRWGSGKTSLMRMLEKRFEDDGNVKTIWFNAWAHGREEPIGLALLQQVLIEFQKEEKTKEKIGHLIENVGKLLTDAALRKTTGITFEEAKEVFKNSIEVKSTLRDDFETAIDECLQDKRLVVFIDDLDRCLPEKTIEILEVIKLFLDVPRCVFVIGVEREVIERGIEVRYKSGEQEIPISGKDYIEKIIQVPFTLPPIREADMTRFIEKRGISEKEKGLAEIVAKVTGCNPRKVKMFLNTLRIRQAIAERTGEGIEPELTVKLFAIESTFPEFYKDVVKYREQDFLCKLERLAKGEADEELRKELEESETMQKYYKSEDLKNLLKNEPLFCGIFIEPYIYLSGKPPEEVLVFDESLLNELLSGDFVKIEHATSAIKKMPDSDKHQYLYILTPKLKAKNEEIRVNAAKALGCIGDAKAVEPLIGALKDWNADVRQRVAEALGGIGDAKAVEPLIDALKDEDVNVRGLAAGALGDIVDAKAVDPLLEALKDENEYVRGIAARALERVGDARGAEPLIEALKDENEYVRLNATKILGSIGDIKAIEPLMETLKDEDGVVRERAAWALGKIGDTKAVEPLIDALKDKEASVRGSATRALGKIGDAKAVEPLIEALKDKEASVRWNVAGILGGIGDAKAVELLTDALKDKSGYVREGVAVALGRISNIKAVKPLIEALEDKNEYVRESAIVALGNIGDAKAAEPLIGALKDKEDVCWRAAWALGRIGDAKAVGPLIETLKDGDERVRRNAAEALGKIGDAKAVEPLIEALKDKEASLRGSAAKALGRVGAAKAAEPLIEALNDEDEFVRKYAKDAIDKIKAK
jgi:HEAT repeat protein